MKEAPAPYGIVTEVERFKLKDAMDSIVSMSEQEVRLAVSTYYQLQEYRKSSANQLRTLVEGEKNSEFMEFIFKQMKMMERTANNVMKAWAEHNTVATWSMSIAGIGPVLSSGLSAHIDITRAPTVGHIWSYGGVNPTMEWKKGQKRPYNAELKVLLYKIGESFVKVSNNDNDVYGKVYKKRKEQEQMKNANKEFQVQAEKILETKKIGKATVAYKSYAIGELPAAHIHARARRYAVKLFLAHWHEIAYFNHYQTLPPKPYVIEHLGHAHLIEPPNMHLIPGLAAAKAQQG